MSEGLDNLDFEGKVKTLSAFDVRVTATVDELAITAAVDPSVLDQEFFTIERTSA